MSGRVLENLKPAPSIYLEPRGRSRRALRLALVAACMSLHAAAGESWLPKKFIDPEDGKLDASEFLASAYGFLPIGTIITDPAVGYGGALGLVFIQPNESAAGAPARPDMSIVGGFATENGSWGGVAGDSRNWRDGRTKSLLGGFYASVNLEFGGLGALPDDTELGYNLLAKGAVAEGRTKLGESDAWLGLRYLLADVRTTFDRGNDVPGIEPREYEQRISGLTPLASYDSRDNMFTPGRGIYAEGSVAVYNDALGSDSDFEIVTLTGFWFHPLGESFTFGLRGDAAASFDDTPFYLRPYVQLRGLQSLLLQGETVANVEAELRWQRTLRWSFLAFAGAGAAWQGLGDFERERDAVTGGLGVRYLVARRMGVHMGFDVAFGPDDPIVYLQFGHAWFRP